MCSRHFLLALNNVVISMIYWVIAVLVDNIIIISCEGKKSFNDDTTNINIKFGVSFQFEEDALVQFSCFFFFI